MKLGKRKLGVGSLSLLLFIIGFVIAGQFVVFSVMDEVLAVLGKAAFTTWDSADPFFIYLTLLFTIPSVIIGYVFKDHFGSRVGRTLSLVLILCIFAWNIGYKFGTVYLLPKF